MADYQSIEYIRFFNSYDEKTKKLKYSKKNFNFDLYKKEFKLENKTPLEVFDHFLVKNDTAFFNEPDFLNKGDKTPSYLKPTKVKPDLVKYFTPMTNNIINHNKTYAYSVHSGYMHIQDPPTYVSTTELVRDQFRLIFYKDNQLRRLQDYYYSDNDGFYTKYNFNFGKYSEDFKVYGNNLEIFTDAISRIIYSSGTYIGIYGNGNPRGFKKYFIQSDGLIDYMDKFGTTSIYKNVSQKNIHNIDYLDYAKRKNLGKVTVTEAREHYIRWGQFTQVKLKFIKPVLSSKEINANSVCTIATAAGMGCGFIYKNRNDSGDKNLYVVTTNHILSQSNLSTFIATFNIRDNSRNNISTKAQFRVMGRDRLTDIMVGVYDPELPYNNTFKPDLSVFKALKINLTSDYKIGEKIYTVGNITTIDNKSLLSGSIIDPQYSGDFTLGSTYSPESLLLDIKAEEGLSGAPIFKENDDSEVVGMILGAVQNKKYTISLTSFLFENLVTNIISRYVIFKDIYANNPTLLAANTARAVPRRWLGCVTSYYHPIESSKISAPLGSFPNPGGLVLYNFILGFDFVKNEYVFDIDSLTRENITKLDGPLLETKLYKRFVDTGRTPIVLKSITFQDGLIGQYSKYNFGKFGNQDGFYKFTYGFAALGSKPVPKGKGDNSLVAILGKIILEYFYFNGREWILEKEIVNDDYDEKWFTSYKDVFGNTLYESKWTYPPILYSYEKSYIKMLNTDKESSIFSDELLPLNSDDENVEENKIEKNSTLPGGCPPGIPC